MSNKIINANNELIDINNIYEDIKEKIIIARGKMLKHINTTMTEVYWYVGKITHELSNHSTKATYGKQIIEALSAKLTNEFGTGFSPVSIRRMRKFYEIYPIWSAVPTELSWSHFQELIRINRKEEREFYENEPIGILLCTDKDEAVVEMTLGDNVKNIYASNYLTYLPSKEELIKIIKDEKELIELTQNNEKKEV